MPATDKDGYAFIDRNGARFEVILNWLQTGDIRVLDLTEAECIRKDALYFNVCSLVMTDVVIRGAWLRHSPIC